MRDEKLLDNSLERIKLFNDSRYLSEALRDFAEETNYSDPIHYYLCECAEHIDGQWVLLLDFKKAIGLRK